MTVVQLSLVVVWAGSAVLVGVRRRTERTDPAMLAIARLAALGPQAARDIQKARASQNAVAIEPGRYTVVLEPTAVGNLVQLLAGAAEVVGVDLDAAASPLVQ